MSGDNQSNREGHHQRGCAPRQGTSTRAEPLTASGQNCWPPTGRISWPPTSDSPAPRCSIRWRRQRSSWHWPTRSDGRSVDFRRTQDPSARGAHHAALEVTRSRTTSDLGPPVLPLRDPNAEVGSGGSRQGRPRPGQLRRCCAHRAPLHLSGARFFPLSLSTVGGTRSSCSAEGSTPPAAAGRTDESSNASTSNGTSNAPDTATGRHPPGHPSPPSSRSN